MPSRYVVRYHQAPNSPDPAACMDKYRNPDTLPVSATLK